MSVLLPYLLSHRTRLASVEQDYDDEEAAKSTSTEEERRHDTTAELSGLTAEQHAQLAEAVDTAILKVCLSHCNLASSSQIFDLQRCVKIAPKNLYISTLQWLCRDQHEA